MDQLVFLIVVAVIALLQWLIRKSQEAQEARQAEAERQARAARHAERGAVAAEESAERQRPPSPAPVVRDPEQERLRRFLEALGVPDTVAAPPPPIPVPRPAAPAPAAPQAGRPISPRQGAPSGRRPLPPARRPTPAAARAEAPPPPLPSLPPTVAGDILDEAFPEGEAAPSRTWAIPELAAPDRPVAQTVRELLGSRPNLQAAILLREVFGPPRALADWATAGRGDHRL